MLYVLLCALRLSTRDSIFSLLLLLECFFFLSAANAIPIKSWFSDPSDEALLDLLPFLDALRFTHDVRTVLSRNLQQHNAW